MTAELKLLERLIRHQVMIQRLSSGQIKRALPILRQLAKDLRARIAAGDATEFAMGRMLTLERDIQVLVTEATDSIQQQLELEAFATQEIDFTQRLLGAAVTVDLAQGINTDMVAAVTTRRQLTLVSGDTVKRLTVPQMFDELSTAVGRDALRTVQAGVIEGRTQQDMARDVARMVTTRSRRQAETVIRTAVNGIGGAARNEVFAANSDIIEGEKWTSTLDGRTTPVCRSRDGEVYPLGQGPRPPAHYGCRSLMRPVIKEQYRLAQVGDRASMNGPVDSRVTYGGWLKRQPKEFQDDVLGPRRAALFRSGKLRIDQFTDDMGRALTLDELAARYDLTMS
ncbi:minor capsid protein [Halomonas sp. DN3]|uniref:minor capsid protein n=1 Tax=Halomonas sp. DN3 TaxID=2953657 RepID=UPI00209EF1A2|nr:minor capsid protein [Halomonas sp. DN3]USZ48125.1 minor capsid protein [Halomonas sp. DN3]